MNIFNEAYQRIQTTTTVGNWPRLLALVEGASEKASTGWKLPYLVGVAFNGSAETLISGVAAIGCLQTSVIIIDDLLDEDPDGIHHEVGAPTASNFAAALEAAGGQLLVDADIDPALRLAAVRYYLNGTIGTALGQQWDVAGIFTEEDYWRIAKQKSGVFFGTAFAIGALLGGSSQADAAKLYEIGALYGELVQISDDIKDVLEVPAETDWLLGRRPLPILFAQQAPHPARDEFVELCRVMTGAQPEAVEKELMRAQQLIVASGALSYGVHQLLLRQREVEQLLSEVDFVKPQIINDIFGRIYMPIKSLFELVGMAVPTL